MGPGFPYAFNIVVASDSGPITERKTLRALERFQAQLANDPRVESVAGPGEFRAETADLGTLKTQLNDSKKLLKGAPKDLGKLEGGLGEAGAGPSSSRTACVKPPRARARSPAAAETPPTARGSCVTAWRPREPARSRSRAASTRPSGARTT